MTTHHLHLDQAPPPPLTGHLPMGDDRIGVNSRHLTRNGRPWIPVSGEFHYSRFPHTRWAAELDKIADGGISVVSSYVIWVHHEEIEGERRFDGDLDLRLFAELCAERGLEFVARIGPWVHGETRNGGLPDWVLEGGPVRGDHPGYLALVHDWFTAVAEQLAGLPVLAIQIENELLDDPAHLLTLKEIAREAGLNAPLWTATGWAAELPPDELLPLFGGYSETFWDEHDTGWPQGCRTHYFFSHERDDNTIGADLRPLKDARSTAELDRYPMATCELGGGMATAYHRRPVVAAQDVAALSLTKLGSGSNWQGYYMYHGGTNPVGQRHPMQESHATGYPNDLPALDYDFQAPIGAHGQLRESYHLLAAQARFLAAFGETLAPMVSVLPEHQPTDVADRETLRWALRTDGDAGFLFVNNHQPYDTLPNHSGTQFELKLPGQRITLPSTPITIPTGAFFFWPVNMEFSGVRLAWATAQPTDLRPDGTLVLTAIPGIPTELAVFDGNSDDSPRIIDDFTPSPDCLITIGDARILVLPAPATPPPTTESRPLSVQHIRPAGAAPRPAPGGPHGRASAPTDYTDAAVYYLSIPAAPHPRLVRIDWTGDIARAYQTGNMIADQYYNGLPWEIAVGTEATELELHILPAPPGAPIYLPHADRADLTRAQIRSAQIRELGIV